MDETRRTMADQSPKPTRGWQQHKFRNSLLPVVLVSAVAGMGGVWLHRLLDSKQYNERTYEVAEFFAEPEDRPHAYADFQVLMNRIEARIAPDTWDHNGGVGSIRFYPAHLRLVVRQTDSVHELLASALAEERSKLDNSMKSVERSANSETLVKQR